ncbi:MAG: hypothetical protein KDA41_04835, partial [Planctomycetales bacterium]|nr:hypothetical protein [Planctomycetales bacterium]
MGLFDWIRSIFSGASDVPRARFHQPGVCPYCGQLLRSFQARQCFECGVAWHDPQKPVRVGRPAAPPLNPPAATSSSTPPVRRDPSLSADEGVFFAGLGVGQSPAKDSAAPAAAKKPPPPQTLAGLELGPFAPATHSEVRQAADQVGSLWGNPWFGRRDLIPPVSDKRTALIDRGMVGQGLITPDELAEIHEIGAQMETIRPDLAQARLRADAAVAQSEAERAAIKQQKKEEAAARKREKAAAVAHRRATDITFLGRGVSRGLADRRANVERLASLGLPVLATPAETAAALGIDVPHLRWLAWHSEAATQSHYVTFTVAKRSGGQRRLAAPHRRLRACQRWILENILAKAPTHSAAHGFVAGRSTLSGAAPHVGQGVVVNADLTDFFPSITFPRVKGAFRSLGYSPAAATILALLCTESPRQTVVYDGQT